jgi:hypothetical protein
MCRKHLAAALKQISRNRAILGIVATLAVAIGSAHAQPIARPFPFTLSTADTMQSGILAGLMPETGPAGKHGEFHLSPEGHFVTSDGTRIKFFGTEIQWTANFIDGQHSEILAKHLRKMGFNALRLNAYDYWGWDDASIFSYNDSTGHATRSYYMNALHASQFDTLLYWLKQEGIYVFLPVHAFHPFAPNDGVPHWDSLYYYGFFSGMLYPEAAQLQRNWARTLLAHVNPLTGIALGKDPAIACYEISFEESLPWYWRLNRTDYKDANNFWRNGGLNTMCYADSRRLDTLFNGYLLKKYGSDAAISSAWSGAQNVNSNNLLTNGSFENFDNTNWNIYSNSPARAAQILSNPGFDASPATMIHISKIDVGYRQDAVVFFNSSSTAKLAMDAQYEFSFRAKLARDAQYPALTRSFVAFVSTADNGQGNLAAPVTIDTTWREYTLPFRCLYGGAQNAGVVLTSDSGNILFDAFSLKQIPDQGLRAGETLAGARIQRIPYDTMTTISLLRARDETAFYDSLQRTYYRSMVSFVRDTLRAAGLVNATGGNYGATTVDYHSMHDAEVTEMHTGWDYVGSRPSTSFSDTTWMLRNYAMVNDAGFYALSLCAGASVAGKANVVGEWEVPYANQHASEQAVLPVVYACYQDWDGVFFAPYAAYRDQLFVDTLVPGFINGNSTGSWNNIASNHALMAQMPMASYVFRNSLVPPAQFFDTIHHDVNDVRDLPHYGYRGPFGQPAFQYGDQAIVSSIGVRQQYDTKHADSSFENIYAHTSDETTYPNQDLSKTSAISLDPINGTFTASEPNMYAYTGLTRDSIVFPRLTLRRTDAANDNLAMYYLFSPDSGFGLLSLSTRTQNSGVVWMDTMGFGKNWGHGPTVMSAAQVQLTVHSPKDSVFIVPLDAFGNPTSQIIAANHIGTSDRFTTTIDQLSTKAAWYLILEKNSAIDAAVATENAEDSLWIEVSPNPVATHATVSISSHEPVRLSLIDDLGRVVENRVVAVNAHEHTTWNFSEIPSGHYIFVARAAGISKAVNVTVTK